jgi:hypothetical protein
MPREKPEDEPRCLVEGVEGSGGTFPREEKQALDSREEV